MNVILMEKIAKLGNIGEAVKVKSGYARNFLFPRGKAVPANQQNLEEIEQRRSELMAAHNEKVAHAQSRAEKLANLAIAIEVNASDEGRLFGSVSSREVAEAVNEKAGSDLVKSEVILPGSSIRQCGDYEVTADLGYEVTVNFALSVINRGAPAHVVVEGEDAEEAHEAGATAEAEEAAGEEPVGEEPAEAESDSAAAADAGDDA